MSHVYLPVIKTKSEMKKSTRPLYIIRDYMDSVDTYEEFQESIFTLITRCIEYRDMRNYPIHFKFYENDKETYTLPLKFFLCNVIYWSPLVHLRDIPKVMDSSYIISIAEEFIQIDKWINKMMLTLDEYNVKNTVINKSISLSMFNLRRINGDFSLILGLNFDMLWIIELFNKNEKFRKIMLEEIDEKLQPVEIEEILDSIKKELIELLINDPDNPIGIILKTKTGIKDKQLVEFLSVQGLKPNLAGETIALPIKNSTVLKGLQTPADLCIDGLGSRKSQITSRMVIGTAGHFGKILTELSRTLSLSHEVFDCGTRHRVPYYVTNKKFLQKINGKFYGMEKNSPLMKINYEKDQHLIGKTIYVRSAATCALEDKICPVCFGNTAKFNFDIADGVTSYTTMEETKVFEQNLLSTKHFLTTNSSTIKFNEEFYNFFEITSDEITPITDVTSNSDIEDWYMYIPQDNIAKNDELDDNEGLNTYISNGEFRVVNEKTGEFITMKEHTDKELYLTDECIRLMSEGKKKDRNKIYFSNMDPSEPLFIITINNNELTKPVYDLISLINSDKYHEDEKTITSVSQRYIDLLIDGGIGASAVSAEIVINRLIRDVDDIYKRPDFGQIRLPKYQIVTCSKASEKNPSPLIGISYQYIKRQLLNDDISSIRTKPSFIDPMYKERVSMKSWKKHLEYKRNKKKKDM